MIDKSIIQRLQQRTANNESGLRAYSQLTRQYQNYPYCSNWIAVKSRLSEQSAPGKNDRLRREVPAANLLTPFVML